MKLGISPASLNAYESDKTEPPIKLLLQLTELYGVGLLYLVSGKEEEVTFPSNSSIMSIKGVPFAFVPVVKNLSYDLERDQLGYEMNGYYFIDSNINYFDIQNTMKDLIWAPSPDETGMVSIGIFPGNYILISLQRLVPNGKIAMVIVDNKRMMCRKIYSQEDSILLVAADWKLNDESYDYSRVKIIGQVIGTSIPFHD